MVDGSKIMRGITDKGPATRLFPLDALRGLIVVLMALDHANHFIAQKHSSGEYWGGLFPVYREALPFLTRLVTHPVAPGFSFLMGVGMALFAAARHRQGWGRGRISLQLALRGLLLVFLQLAVVNRAWELSPQGWGLEIYFGVLIALGGGMILGGMLVWLGPAPLAGVGIIVLLTAEILTPDPAQWGTPFPFVQHLLLVPGGRDGWWINYPVLQWLELAIFGIVFGKLLVEGQHRLLNRAWILGLGFLVVFALLRVLAGFGNIRPAAGDSWIDFLNLVKYPPSLTFIFLTMGFNLVVLSLFARVELKLQHWVTPLAVFGRVPLFFYVAHLFLYAALGNLIAPRGMTIPAMLPFWLAGLAVLYPACRWYGQYKGRQPVNSLLRFF